MNYFQRKKGKDQDLYQNHNNAFNGAKVHLSDLINESCIIFTYKMQKAYDHCLVINVGQSQFHNNQLHRASRHVYAVSYRKSR